MRGSTPRRSEHARSNFLRLVARMSERRRPPAFRSKATANPASNGILKRGSSMRQRSWIESGQASIMAMSRSNRDVALSSTSSAARGRKPEFRSAKVRAKNRGRYAESNGQLIKASAPGLTRTSQSASTAPELPRASQAGRPQRRHPSHARQLPGAIRVSPQPASFPTSWSPCGHSFSGKSFLNACGQSTSVRRNFNPRPRRTHRSVCAGVG